ncbi:MAG: BrnA antitoxin family protein [Phyllobacteriaceae bacterium]|nr:BrnA antitoxin family protein [Phyllobacteriaceae bacterium]
MKKPEPAFASEAEERAFWESHDSADRLDWSKAGKLRLPNLKPSSVSISLRLPQSLLERIKIAAAKRDVPYQSLIKVWLNEKADGEGKRLPRPNRADAYRDEERHVLPLPFPACGEGVARRATGRGGREAAA